MADETPALNNADSPNKGPEARLLDLLDRMRNNAAASGDLAKPRQQTSHFTGSIFGIERPVNGSR